MTNYLCMYEVHFIDGSINQHICLNILKESLALSKQKVCLGENFYFYQDNQPKHKAYNVRSQLLYNCPHVMDTPVSNHKPNRKSVELSRS